LKLDLDACRHWARGLVYPGLDLHTRNRASLCRFWKSGPRDVLDAGSGNGYFAWRAYQSGARVVALNFERDQVEKARAFILGYSKADPGRLCFEQSNLYDLPKRPRFRRDHLLRGARASAPATMMSCVSSIASYGPAADCTSAVRIRGHPRDRAGVQFDHLLELKPMAEQRPVVLSDSRRALPPVVRNRGLPACCRGWRDTDSRMCNLPRP